ncbi:hypothetical protein [Mycolicibacterium hippocampi]|uniref:Uncharacterized protein n=1 Tax=Mycolicibacterium hippocampi TaxID=659824 RepID=A0A7I9ZML9_9MYCO|nr:hypothetical protein [Mycolicibacterium hippocampi]GFH01878.1 hypothetical protein MHIP_23610 [Mycolicibacterium hippocampi]
MTSPHPDVDPHFGSAKLIAVTVVALVAAFNLTAVSAALHPLLGLMTLLVALLVTVAVVDRLGQRWAPAAVKVFDRWCRATARHLRTD